MNFLRHPSIFLTLSDVLALLCLFVMAINGTISLRPLEETTSLLFGGIALLFLGLMVGSLVNGDPLRGLVVGGQYTFAYLILPLVLLTRDENQTILLVKIFVGSIFLMCLHGIYEVNIAGIRNEGFVSGAGRWGGFVERANTAGCLIGITIPLLLCLVANGHIRPILSVLVFSIFTYGLLLTGSNTGLIAFVYGLTLYFAATVTWKRLLIAMGIICTFIFLLSDAGRDYLPVVFQKRVLAAVESGELSQAGTFTGRYDLVTEATHMIERSIFVGVGADQHRLLSHWGAPVHNAYLLIWSEGGLFALIGFLLILLAFLIQPIRTLRLSGGWITGVCSLSIVSAFAVINNGSTHAYERSWLFPVFLSVALCGIYLRRRRFSQIICHRPGSQILESSGLPEDIHASRRGTRAR